VGEWDLIKSGGDDLSGKTIKPWVFNQGKSVYEVVSYNKENVSGNLRPCFSRLAR
jgi:hypothetical protein